MSLKPGITSLLLAQKTFNRFITIPQPSRTPTHSSLQIQNTYSLFLFLFTPLFVPLKRAQHQSTAAKEQEEEKKRRRNALAFSLALRLEAMFLNEPFLPGARLFDGGSNVLISRCARSFCTGTRGGEIVFVSLRFSRLAATSIPAGRSLVLR